MMKYLHGVFSFTGIGMRLGVLVGLVYLYVTLRSGGMLWLLIWRSPVMAFGAWLYGRTGWRWPKSLWIWIPFGIIVPARSFGQAWAMREFVVDPMSTSDLSIAGLTTGQFFALYKGVSGVVALVPLLVAVYFFIRDARQRGAGGEGDGTELAPAEA